MAAGSHDMTPRICDTCRHSAMAEVRGVERLCCTRPMTMRDGKINIMGRGTSVVFERDFYPEAHRADGDKCGPEGLHWEGRR